MKTLSMDVIGKRNIFFWAGIICEFVASFSGYLFGGYHELTIIMIGMGFFAIKILLSMDWRRDIIPYAILGLYGLACYYFQHSALVLRIILVILAGRDQNVKDVIKVFFWGTGLAMIYAAVMSAFGLHNSMYVEAVFRKGVERRYCFGFFHPNGFSFFLFRMACFGLYLYIDCINKIAFCAISVVALILAYMAGSKMLLSVMLLLMASCALYKFIKSESVSKIIGILGNTLMGLVILFLVYIRFSDRLPQNEFFYKIWMGIDVITTGRSGDSYYLMLRERPTLLGVGFSIETTELGFINSLYSNGIIFVLLFIVLSFVIFNIFRNKKDTVAMIVIYTTFAYAIAESYLAYINKNLILMLCIGNLLLPKIGLKNEEKDKN